MRHQLLCLVLFAPAVYADGIFQAVRSGDTAEVSRLLKTGKNANEVETVGTDEKTPLMAAIDQMDAAMAALLIKQKNTVNFKTPGEGKTPLMYASGLGETYGEATIATMKLLIEAGARVDDVDKNKRSAIFYAVESAWATSLNTILAAKPQLNIRDNYGNTPLTLAAEKGYAEMARGLLQAGADPNLVKPEKNLPQTPLYIAIQGGYPEVARVLLENKANPNMKTPGLGADTPLIHLVVTKQDTDLLRAFINHGADLNITDVQGFTPLIEACRSDATQVVRVLIELKADVNFVDKNGHRALYYARDAEIIQMLRKAGAKK